MLKLILFKIKMRSCSDLTVDVDESRQQKMLNDVVMTRLGRQVETREPFSVLQIKSSQNKKNSTEHFSSLHIKYLHVKICQNNICLIKSFDSGLFLHLNLRVDPRIGPTLCVALAPARSRYRTTSMWSFSLASIRGVRWSSSHVSKLAPA